MDFIFIIFLRKALSIQFYYTTHNGIHFPDPNEGKIYRT